MLTYSYVLNEKPNSNYKIVEKTIQKTQKIQVENYFNSTAETTMNHRLWIKPQLTGNTHKKGRTKKWRHFTVKNCIARNLWVSLVFRDQMNNSKASICHYLLSSSFYISCRLNKALDIEPMLHCPLKMELVHIFLRILHLE